MDEAIANLSAEIDEVIAPFEAELALLDTITGVNRRTAEGLVAEIGVDMARFGSPQRLAFWAGMCPGHHESAGKQRSGKARKGSKWLGTYLAEAAKAAGKSHDTYLAAQYHRLRGRRGHAKATKAVGHSILVAAYHILDRGVPYHDLGADWFNQRRPDAQIRKLTHQLNGLGYQVTLNPLQAA